MSEKYKQLYLELLLKMARKVKFVEEQWICGENEFTYKLENTVLIVRKNTIGSSISSFELVLANNLLVCKQMVTVEDGFGQPFDFDISSTSVFVSFFDKSETLLDSDKLYLGEIHILGVNETFLVPFKNPELKEIWDFLHEMNVFIRSIEKNYHREKNGIEEKLKSSLLEL